MEAPISSDPFWLINNEIESRKRYIENINKKHNEVKNEYETKIKDLSIDFHETKKKIEEEHNELLKLADQNFEISKNLLIEENQAAKLTILSVNEEEFHEIDSQIEQLKDELKEILEVEEFQYRTEITTLQVTADEHQAKIEDLTNDIKKLQLQSENDKKYAPHSSSYQRKMREFKNMKIQAKDTYNAHVAKMQKVERNSNEVREFQLRKLKNQIKEKKIQMDQYLELIDINKEEHESELNKQRKRLLNLSVVNVVPHNTNKTKCINAKIEYFELFNKNIREKLDERYNELNKEKLKNKKLKGKVRRTQFSIGYPVM